MNVLRAGWPFAVVAVGLAVWPAVWATGASVGAAAVAALAGLSILAAAFALSWAVEAVEDEVPPFLALTALALVGLLPEFAVDATFAWASAGDPSQAPFVMANMTGGNRMLVGLGWPLVAAVGLARGRSVALPASSAVAVVALGLASAWMVVPLGTARLGLLDAGALLAVYGLALFAAARGGAGPVATDAPAERDALDEARVGPAAHLAALPVAARHAAVIGALVASAAAILLAAEPFSAALVDLGRAAGVEEFVLVQWVAPVASEAPELVVAGLLAAAGHPGRGLALLVASQVNQWTLLVGALPVLSAVAGAPSLPLVVRQQVEIGLTVALGAFALALVLGRGLRLGGASARFAAYLPSHAMTGGAGRAGLAAGLLAVAGVRVAASPTRRAAAGALVRDAVRAARGI